MLLSYVGCAVEEERRQRLKVSPGSTEGREGSSAQGLTAMVSGWRVMRWASAHRLSLCYTLQSREAVD